MSTRTPSPPSAPKHTTTTQSDDYFTTFILRVCEGITHPWWLVAGTGTGADDDEKQLLHTSTTLSPYLCSWPSSSPGTEEEKEGGAGRWRWREEEMEGGRDGGRRR